MSRGARRFHPKKVITGPFKGGFHVSSARHLKFIGQLSYLHTYLTNRLLPTDPEDVTMQGILIILQNLLEHESEILIGQFAKKNGSTKELAFHQRIEAGYVSFKTKMDWLLARKLIEHPDWDIMEEIRRLRNEYAHSRPSSHRLRFRYCGYPLLTNQSLRKLFTDVELTLRTLRSKSGNKSRWMIIPPRYASETGWTKDQIQALEGSEQKER
jgi:hypothetical protein